MKKATKYVGKKEFLQIEPNTTYRKFKESAQKSLVEHPTSQPSLDISSIWTPVITAEVRKLKICPVQIMYESCIFMLVSYKEYVSLTMNPILIALRF
jgi:hypothetical protein